MDTLNKDKLTCINPSILDKKIELKTIKQKKTIRTFVFGLEVYIEKPTQMNKIIKELKTNLGTSCVNMNIDNFGFGYGFCGEHIDRIKTYLIDKKYVSFDDFK